MHRRTATLLVSAALAIGLGVGATSLHVPYVRLEPGPTSNTLGSQDGRPLITIAGHQTYNPSGRLDLVTVSELGGPGAQLSIGDVLSGWFDDHVAVVPSSLLFPRGQTPSQVQQENSTDMIQSQENAKNAALRYLGYTLSPAVFVAAVAKGSPSDGVLEQGDLIVAVDGAPTKDSNALLAALQKHKPGDDVSLTIVRDGKQSTVTVGTREAPGDRGRPQLGVQVFDDFVRPFVIDIDLENVGGPSAGMMFALGIIDKITPDDLTGGRIVAGTGTIDQSGNVGAIGGVQQKMVGARRDGATVFLVPKGNCATAVKAIPNGLRLVPVTTLSDAVSALKTIRGGGSDVPSCPSS